ncbi:MAG: 1-acyl-sn-glycerol-3-phosphate acyltransferase [Gammaproteobacteria bacterium]|nr:1-acyl-sn-glycerol-3-phosphate acyltransferase [Gammaproteobacteria bacterium]
MWWVSRRLLRASRTDWGRGWLNVLDGLLRLFVRYYHRAHIEQIDLPEEGAALLVSNHVSGLDPMLLVAATRRPLRFIIAKEEYERFGLKWLFRAIGCIPVDRTSRPERALRHARSALKRGEVIALFPHGKIHLDSDPPRKLKRGFAKLSEWENVPVYPCRIDGVKGVRHTVLAVFIRGWPRLRPCQATRCNVEAEQDCLESVADCIEARHGSSSD